MFAAPAVDGESPAGSVAEVKAQPALEGPAVASATDDREIFVDDQGLRYRILVIPKRPGGYVHLPNGNVRLLGGVTREVVTEDETTFGVKQYLPIDEAPAAAPRPKPDPERIAASYRVSMGSVDRLRLESADRGLPRRGQWRNGFDLADLNGDGRLDIAFGPARKSRPLPNLFLNGESTSWKRDEGRRFPRQAYDYGDIAVADFNGDGRPDLALAFHLLGLSVLVDDAKGGFTPWSRGIDLTPLGAEPDGIFSSRAIEVADWNGDGRPDIVALGDGPQLRLAGPVDPARLASKDSPDLQSSTGVRVFLNRGDGSWDTLQDEPGSFASGSFGDDLAVGDLDRDGRPDLVVASGRMSNNLLLGRQGSDGSLQWERVPGVRPFGMVQSVELADFDADGRLDLAMTYLAREGQWRSGVDLLWGGSEGFERQPLVSREGRRQFLALVARDLDGDGKVDLAIAGEESELILLVNEGNRRFAREALADDELELPSSTCAGRAVRAADLDGDGAVEIVLALAGDESATSSMGLRRGAGCEGGGSLRVWSVKRRHRAGSQVEQGPSSPD